MVFNGALLQTPPEGMIPSGLPIIMGFQRGNAPLVGV